MVCKICSSKKKQISPWNGWNDAIAELVVVRECHVDMCFGLRRNFLGVVQEKGPSRGEVARWVFLGIEDEPEIAVVGTPHGIVFSRSIRRVPKEDSGDGMLLDSIRGAPWELQPGAEGGVVNRVQLDVQAAILKREKLHRRQSGNSCQDELTSGDQWNWRGMGTQTDVSGANMRGWV